MCTNKIEVKWWGLKRKIPARSHGKAACQEHILVLIWHHQNLFDLWSGFLNAMKNTCYEDTSDDFFDLHMNDDFSDLPFLEMPTVN
eukprot:5443405-Ditylum_brightwellii.AAC.1